MRYYESAYPVFASTDGIAYEVYISGCKGYCEGCHSPHTHDFDAGLDLEDNDVLTALLHDIRVKYDDGELNNIVIISGEPLDQPIDVLLAFLHILNHEFPKCEFWMYTHFEEEDIHNQFSEVLDYLDYIKCGKFDKDKYSREGFADKLTGIRLASSNQYFIKGNRSSK